MSTLPLMSRLLSGRALWIGLAVALSSLLAYFRRRARAGRLSGLMQLRGGVEESAPSSVVERELRSALEKVTEMPGLRLNRADRLDVTYDLGLRETRQLIDLLEDRLDCSLPDSKLVRSMTVGELLDVLNRRVHPHQGAASE